MKIIFFLTLSLLLIQISGLFRPKTLKSYQNYLQAHKYTLSLYYHPHCSLSLSMKIPFKRAFKALKGRARKGKVLKDLGIALVNVKKLGISIDETPKFVILRRKTPYKVYLGDYYKEIPLLDWVIKEIGKDVREIEDKSGVLNAFDTKNQLVLMVIDENDLRADEVIRNLVNLKEIFKEIHFIWIHLQNLYNYNIAFWKLQCFEGEVLLKEGSFSLVLKDFFKKEVILKAFEDFFYGNNKPYMFEEVLLRRLLARNYEVLLYYVSRIDEKNHRNLEMLLKYIEKNKNLRLFYAFKNKNSGNLIRWVRFLGLSDENPFNLVLLTQETPDHNIMKYHYKGELTPEGLNSFYQDYQTNNLAYFLRKSKEIPQNKANFYRLTSKGYEDFMKESHQHYNKDLLIGFCPISDKRCDNFLIFFEELSEELFHLESLIFGYFDPETDDFKGKEVRLFPLIRLFPAGNRDSLIEYKGNQIEKEKIHLFLRNSLTILNSTNIRRNPL